MKVMTLFCYFGVLFVSSSALGADPDAGRRLAQLECAACHIVAPNQREELADAPPFEVIGRKFGFNFDMLVLSLMGPHAKMNFSLRRSEAGRYRGLHRHLGEVKTAGGDALFHAVHDKAAFLGVDDSVGEDGSSDSGKR
jgi:hypothetical protein